ncbi:uncharacterized protein LOC108916208 [Anoplophora glabripennis]|uniref:uncharacterized protein LOC108916208 n=1 Tax=Anoplophora glabripennis TaxID=217634 RepID=UPI000C789653|nr:uncharacterized protein LOC108916208 [Anoplophora glabripennis]
MLPDSDVEDHYNPSVRLVEIERNGSTCGFHLTRGKWDPYPWVSGVDDGSVAAAAGMKPGDCLLEVNGEDIIGHRISEVAEIVRSKPDQVSLLLWNAGIDPQCTPEALCCGPLPNNLQRLSACMSTILAFLECPVCLDTISPPTYQCDNGHLICIRCRTRSERCPVCRLRLSRARSLLSDQVYNALIDTFNLREEADETRAAKIQKIFKSNKKGNVPDIKITHSHTNKFLAKIIGKSSSVDNLTSNKFLSPNISTDENYFNSSHLKTKSLSTNEIFQSASPGVSRSGSISRLSRRERTDQNIISINNSNFNVETSASCHGSLESLDTKSHTPQPKAYNSLGYLKNLPQDEGILFYCPFSNSCTKLVKGNNIFEHFQLNHSDNGPLIQYFSPKFEICSKKLEEENDICYAVTTEGNLFFLKVNSHKSDDTSMYLQDILIWVWYLGNKMSAKDYEFKVEIKSGDSDDVLLSVRSSVFSLGSVTLQEIIELKRGVFLSSKTLQALEFQSKKLTLDIHILKCDS